MLKEIRVDQGFVGRRPMQSLSDGKGTPQEQKGRISRTSCIDREQLVRCCLSIIKEVFWGLHLSRTESSKVPGRAPRTWSSSAQNPMRFSAISLPCNVSVLLAEASVERLSNSAYLHDARALNSPGFRCASCLSRGPDRGMGKTRSNRQAQPAVNQHV